jgi:hypothetical protein
VGGGRRVPALGSARAEGDAPTGGGVILIDQRERRISGYGPWASHRCGLFGASSPRSFAGSGRHGHFGCPSWCHPATSGREGSQAMAPAQPKPQHPLPEPPRFTQDMALQKRVTFSDDQETTPGNQSGTCVYFA